MSILIVYETRFGATRAMAEEIATGARRITTVEVRSVEDVASCGARFAELIVLGAPTRSRTLSYAHHVGADGIASATEGRMREWLELSSLPVESVYVAFDTRFEGPRLFGGTASRRIVAMLRGRDVMVGSPPVSFVESVDHRPEAGERLRAREWGEAVARRLVAA